MSKVRIRRRDSLKLDEVPQPLDLIEMNAHVLPQEQAATLGDDPAYPDRGIQCRR